MLKNITAKMYKLNKMLEQEVKTLSNNKDISKKDPKSLLMSVLFHDDHMITYITLYQVMKKIKKKFFKPYMIGIMN